MIEPAALAGLRRIASRANPRVKEWAGLKDKANRDALGLTLAEGAGMIAEGLDAAGGQFRPIAFIVSDSGAARPEAGTFLAKAREKGIQLFNLADDCYDKISGLGGADGLALVMEFDGDEPDLSALFATASPRWLIAACVQDPGNAGALARTALAAGVNGCLFLDGADPHSPKFLRGSMGAAFRLPCLSLSSDDFLTAWKPSFARLTAAVSGSEAVDYRKADYSEPLALLIGGEKGIPRAIEQLAAARIRVPLRNNVESLNLAVAAGIILFEAERIWKHG